MKYGHVKTDKIYFSSSEAAEAIGVSVSVLHSWEKDFPALIAPKKNKNGKRIYKQSDIEAGKQLINGKEVKITVKKKQTSKITAVELVEPANNKELLMNLRNKLQKTLNNIKTSR
jgi:DNA-binding transcriptional MerR regulator